MKVLSRKIEVEENDTTRVYLFVGMGNLPGESVKFFTDEEEALEHKRNYPFPGKLSKCVFIEEIK